MWDQMAQIAQFSFMILFYDNRRDKGKKFFTWNYCEYVCWMYFAFIQATLQRKSLIYEHIIMHFIFTLLVHMAKQFSIIF